MPTEYFFHDRATMLAELQSALCAQLQRSLARAEHTTLFLSGGDSPGPLYRALAFAPLPWKRISTALVDERWVPPTHEASNERLVRDTLLREQAADSAFTGMWSERELHGAGESAAVDACNRAYDALPQSWSAALLGMGPDGHTASLFPKAERLQEVLASRSLCAAMHAPPGSCAGKYLERMTMTPHALLRCEQLYLLITGEDKRALYEKALATADQAALPMSIFLQQNTVPLAVYWSP